MNNDTFLNIISPKALERQLRLVETKISSLQSEMSELEKIKSACLVLMGNPEGVASIEAAVGSKPKKRKATESGEEIVESEPVPTESASPDEAH